jgi:hypothetical protein
MEARKARTGNCAGAVDSGSGFGVQGLGFGAYRAESELLTSEFCILTPELLTPELLFVVPERCIVALHLILIYSPSLPG